MIKKSIVINITVKKGTPKVNFLFLVLWWNKYIPKREPIPPPISENNNNKLSLILHLFFIAFLLSTPKKIKAIILIPIK